MREDLIRPLRDGITQLREIAAAPRQRGPNRQRADLFVYENVGLGPPSLYEQTGELLIYAQLNVSILVG
jgi:hypothetical protein